MDIAVFGAYGHTARFVLAELLQRGHTPIAIGRDGAKLEQALAAYSAHIPRRVASVDDPKSLDRALAGAAAVINCAGPFLDTAAPLVEAAARAGMHYLDVTAEQASALATFERFDALARNRGILVVPAAGFYGALGDVLAVHATSGATHADRIEIAIALDRWWPTRGTRRTGERNTAPRRCLRGGQLSPLSPTSPASWPFPQPFGTQDVIELPLTETVLIARRSGARDMHNYIAQAPLRDLHDPATPEPRADDERGRSLQRFIVEASVHSAGREYRASVSGRDIYAITAPIVVEALERICTMSPERAGAFGMGQLVDATAFLETLARRGDLTLRSPILPAGAPGPRSN